MDLKPVSKMPEKFDISEKITPRGPTEKNCLAQLTTEHPLSQSEQHFNNGSRNTDFRLLRVREGLHAPLKLAMERQIVKRCGGRLPFLQSSNAHLDVLTGRDEMMTFSDFLGGQEYNRVSKQPHVVMEQHLGIE